MNRKEYNGWTNYETWLCALWIDNDEGSQSFWADQSREVVDELGKDGSTYRLSNMLKDHFESEAEAFGASGFWADLIGAALGEVDWDSIADHYIADVDVDDDAEVEA